jgi:predicted permease
MTGLPSDVRFGLRALAANPVFVVLAVLCLGIGIGASTMTFTLANDALRKPLGSIDREGLVEVWERHQSAPDQWWPLTPSHFEDFSVATGEQAELGAFRDASFVVGPSGEGARIEGAAATGNLFDLLGVAPTLGRALDPADEAPGGAPVVVLGETYWRTQLQADRGVVGRSLIIDGVAHAVVGVVPALLGVGMPRTVRLARLWVPLRARSQSASRTDRSWYAIARLGDGVSAESFAARLDAVASDLAAVHPEDAGWSTTVTRLGDSSIASSRTALLLSMGAAWLVLLVATANLANLTLAYALRRRHEFGIRAAVGASPWRLARQLLCESFTVAALGAVLGVFLARLGLDVVVRGYEAQTLAPVVLQIDATSLAFTVALTFVATALFGLLPALEVARGATRVQIAESGAGTTATHGRARLRRGLVVAQVAASLVLLVGAALLSRSFMNLLAQDGGVETQRVASIRVESTGAVEPGDVERFANGVLGALAAIPGVEAAASANVLLPLRGGGLGSKVTLPGEQAGASAARAARYVGVTPNFFDTLGISLLRGRSFSGDAEGGRVAVVSETMAKELWPNEEAIGRRFKLDADAERGWVTVVGVSRDVLTWDSSGEKPLPIAYLDLESFAVRPVFFFVRHRGTVAIGAEAITRAIDALGLPVKRIVVTPMEQVARDPFWRQRLFSLWFGIFGSAAVVLTLAGIYGVLAYLVWQRAQEWGIRMALGADRVEVLLLVLREAGMAVGAGVVIGLGAAYALARTLRGLLFNVEPLDWPLFIATAALLTAVAMAASLAPAVRATRVDPKVLLKA